jgi:arylsulfatase A-like enzyme
MGAYGYGRATSPHMDALARRGATFEQAYTYWPKTRGSFVALMTGRRASQSGYSKTHPLLLDHNATLASVLKEAGYDTVAAVDNANVAPRSATPRASGSIGRPGRRRRS